MHRHESHYGHLSQKSTCVIDHLIAKVKQKRLAKQDTSDSSDDISHENINANNNNNRQLEPDHYKSQHKRIIYNDDHIVINDIHNDKDIEENVQQQSNSTKFNKNKKINKSNKGSNPATKIANQSNEKKRRSPLRHTSFQIRDENFNTIFKDLPPEEQLIIAYPCAWKKDVFMHGRIFLSMNYLLFYSCYFKWEERLRIAYKDIISVTREKSAIVIPNEIKLRTKEQDEYLFVSYIPREKFFITIFRVWQNSVLDQPLDYQQLRALVLANQYSHDDSNTLENNDEYAHKSHSTRLNSSAESYQRVISSKLDDENIIYLHTCTCESHPGKTYVDRLFSFNVDTLFELLFSDNSFTRAFHNAHQLLDYTFGEWILNSDTGKKERQVTYKTINQSTLGTHTIFCREKQILEVEKPHLMYILNTEIYNEGMKYTDAFYVTTRFCMVQYDAQHSSLRVTAETQYVKNVNGLIKTFIEKNVNSSIERGINEQVRRLENHQVINMDKNSKKKLISLSQTDLKKSIDNIISQKQIDEDSSINAMSLSRFRLTINGESRVYNIGLIIVICFLLVHIYLWYKLNSIEKLYYHLS
ncbi:unnamed protein product [Rotaria magnacalcarata]|uniref:VASt domain-containing protein n=2 Tax=Rotaria magnacalcarata TaxID=392030 RepID=A0A814ILY9_9BILA|nr:unnamed protein product [Rotaria magnacalcarata]CAF2029709.1 unnamed protein product [Rotaria magnacalcarata]CAF3971198.1 unnamed protein product [Rotaria magnacalcarata]CAF3973399.1 unnamed protein product [Rotaria magnacalcarata]